MRRSRWSGIKAFAGRAIRAEIMILAAVGACCLILGWRSADEITQALWAAGVLALAVGGATLFAGLNPSRRLENHYVLTAMHVLSDEERIRQDKLQTRQARLLLLQGLLLGGLTIGIAFVIDVLAG
jgi:hypothetical protein